jgi:hypothetical protein
VRRSTTCCALTSVDPFNEASLQANPKSPTRARTASITASQLEHIDSANQAARDDPRSVVATIAGWSAGTSVRMAKRYSHIGPSVQRDAMAMLDAKPTSADLSDASDASATVQ